MLTYTELEQLAKAAGFHQVAPLRAETIELNPEVRQMCRQCHAFGTRWSCPPACGTLEQCREHISRYQEGILVQTVRELEDELDGEGMMEAEAAHIAHFHQLYAQLRVYYPDLLPLGTGGCRLCQSCTYPDASCRFPDRMVSSMEAYGMLVMQICKSNQLSYYYGPKTISYTGCFLLK